MGYQQLVRRHGTGGLGERSASSPGGPGSGGGTLTLASAASWKLVHKLLIKRAGFVQKLRTRGFSPALRDRRALLTQSILELAPQPGLVEPELREQDRLWYDAIAEQHAG